MNHVARFRMLERGDASRVISGLEQRFDLIREPEQRVQRVVYETFDWRFLAAGSVLEHRRSADSGVLLWRSLSTGELLGQIATDTVPRFAWELPHAPTVDRMASITEVRALVPLVSLDSRLDVHRVVDDEGKTVARLTLDRTRISDGEELPAVLELAPVRGYGEEVRSAAELLSAQMTLVPEPDDVVMIALRSVGFAPGSYSSKLRLSLDRGSTARQAWTVVLRALFATMQANESGLRGDVDSEFLHDFRVAVRRTRSVLADAKDVLDPDVRAWARGEFRWVGQITSPPRDADVFLLAFPEFEAALPPERRNDLKPFGSFLLDEQRRAHGQLVAALDSQRYRDLVTQWREHLEAEPNGNDGVDPERTPDAAQPAIAVAGARIRKAHRRVIRRGRAIKPTSHPEELHELRKDAKRLRYLLECFGSLYPSDLVTPVVRELKGLQEVLGDFQDSQVQADAIERFGQQMIERNGASAATLLAMGSIVEHLDTQGLAAQESFRHRFERFDTKAVRRSVKRIHRGRHISTSAEDHA